MPSAHEAFKALGPVDWESFAQEDAKTLMTDIFQSAHCLISSIPVPPNDEAEKNSKARGATDPEIPSEIPPLPSRAAISSDASELRKEWKEVKINPRENPLGLDIYKMAAKDGKGAWFARRSVHDGLSFKRWKTAMEREFAESLKVQGSPGDGKIRGLGADKRVEDQTIDGRGKIQVYQLSAQFPGPTAPRDFVTLCLSSDTAITTPAPDDVGEPPRSFTLVSKPCVHPQCPTRQGFVRGSYESVELIREIRVGNSLNGTRPSGNATNNDSSSSMANTSDHNVGTESAISAPTDNDKEHEPKGTEYDSEEEADSVIEWMMITRSDPGGSVPRFIIEKKTPEGIANDANKFIQWISSEDFESLLQVNSEYTPAEADTTRSTAPIPEKSQTSSDSIPGQLDDPRAPPSLGIVKRNSPESPGPGGVYGMLSGALSMMASAAASRILGAPEEDESESENSLPDVSDDSSSIHSFHSFDTTGNSEEPSLSISLKADEDPSPSADSASVSSTRHDKEPKKLEQRRQKTEEKLRRAQERALAKKDDDAQRGELAQQKLREKHEREMAKQEDKYQRERRKLEARRAGEEKKAEERRRKQAERETKANLALELDNTRAERDVARRENEILTKQVMQLQALNTRLVARLGREGISLDDDGTSSSRSSVLAFSHPSGSVTGSRRSGEVD